jgi:eukaryotic-like serine/threonine-protein kinase
MHNVAVVGAGISGMATAAHRQARTGAFGDRAGSPRSVRRLCRILPLMYGVRDRRSRSLLPLGERATLTFTWRREIRYYGDLIMSRADCDRNLLLGVLALQNNFIDRHALVAAFDRWTIDKTKSLADILVELEKLDTDQRQLLDALVAQHLKKHDNDPAKSLASVSSLDLVRKELEQLADPDVQASLAGAAMCFPDSHHAADPFAPTISAGTRSSTGLRFTVLRPHAKGGLGQVSVALDEELNREVAFKEIQDRFADDPNSRSRFVLEAEVTGGLEHPGIVPVYGLGQYADGRPFYAMRFIRGDSLQAAIKRFHDADHEGRDPGKRSLELRKLLGRFIDVCNAVEYAHSRGVLHRDLKPGNVMLGKYGETLVVDWGLAKALGHRESEAESGERTLRPASASGSAQTQMGSAIGTPQYMSPEQAGGRLDELGPATDVYSLGGTLYCLLAGRTPFAEGGAGTILGHVSKGEFPPPQAVKKGVPPVLQAISLKAMALKPASRYPSARALADDVEHWLADEPVAAYREGFVERAGRWLRRHQAAARAAAMVLVALSVVSSLAAVLINAARGEAQRQRDIARDAQKAEAAQVVETRKALAAETAAKNAETAAKNAETAAKNEAKAAIDRYVDTVQESELLKEERFQPLRKKLLSGALGYYQTFIEAHQHDRAVRNDLAMALFKVGSISNSSGSMADALVAFQGASALWEKLAVENPDVIAYQHDQAGSYIDLGVLQRETGDREAALVSYQRALAIEEKLIAENPTVTEYQRDLAKSYNNLGIVQRESGDREAALTSYQRAIAIQEKLVAEDPSVTEYQSDLAKHYLNLGNMQGETGDWETALVSYQRALAIREKLATENPNVTEYQSDLAASYNNLGNLESETGDQEAALLNHQRALTIREKLAVENPTVNKYQSDLAASYNSLGDMADRDAALVNFQRALAIREKLAAENPTVTEYQRDHAGSYYNLGNLQLKSGDRDAALVSYQRALAIQEKLATENSTVIEYQRNLAASYNNLGFLRREMGDRDAALMSNQCALAIQEKLARENPTVSEYQRGLATSYYNIGNLQAETHDREAALLSYHLALTIQEKLASDHPDVLDYQVHLGASYCNLGIQVQDSGDAVGALAWYARAAQTLQRVVDRDDRHTTARLCLRNTHLGRARALGTLARHAEAAHDWQRAAEFDDGRRRTDFNVSRADALARAGDHVHAAALADELVKLSPISGANLYNAACVYTQCFPAVAVGKLPEQLNDVEKALQERYASRAVEVLRRAQSAGFFGDEANVEYLSNDTDFDALRERDDFRKLVEGLPKSPPKQE